MKKLIVILFLMIACQLHAQKTIDGLIKAERSFAAYSVAHGTKDAFLKFADSNGIVFDKGKAANAIQLWNSRDKRPGVLNWWPEFVEIASSNDFGYTTGLWEFKMNDTVVARGQFTTVWHLTPGNEWKFLIDLGVSNTPKYLMLSLTTVKAKKITGEAPANEVLNAEQSFIDAYRTEKVKAYKTYLSDKSILNRNGLVYPASVKKSRSEFIDKTPSNIQFTVTGSGIAPSGDLAYVYGNTLINDKPENYLRIWRRERQGWKIALEVLRY
jgi:ketosteroid isomerase-like protein